MNTKIIRLAIITSHPVQYLVPLWKALAQCSSLNITVYYASTAGAVEIFDPSFLCEIKWDVDLLDNYHWELLANKPLKNWRCRYRCPDLAQKIKSDKFDAALLVGKEYYYYWQAIWALRVNNIPIIYRAETPPLKNNMVLACLVRWYSKIIYSNFSYFAYTGISQYQYYRSFRIAKSKLFFSPYCVDEKFFQTQYLEWRPQRDKLRENYGFNHNQMIIVFVVKFVDVKRPLDLIKAFQLLVKKQNIGLIMAGSGPLLPVCRNYVEKNKIGKVVFPGFKNQKQLGEIYAAADCFVLCSNRETWGLVVNEAMHFHLPVIVSDTVGCRHDLVDHGQNGYIFPMGDVHALVRCLEKLYRRLSRGEKPGEQSANIVARYSVENNVKQIRNILNKFTHEEFYEN